MTTDREGGRRFAWGHRLLRRAFVLFLIVSGWIAVMAGVMFVAEPAPAALALGGRGELLDRLPADVRMMRSSRHMLVLTSTEPGYVRRIYAAGAWLVLPALRNGCLDLRGYKRANVAS